MQEEKKKQRKERKYIQIYISNHKHNPPTHTHGHARGGKDTADIARTWCLTSQPEIVDTFKKSKRHTSSEVCGEFFFFLSADRVTEVDALGKHLWQGM